MATWETAQKCLMFAEGKKKGISFQNVRNADFPESLLRPDSKAGNTGVRIAALMDEGKVCHEIAEAVGLSPGSVSLQTTKIKAKRQFYGEWLDFMETLKETGAGNTPLALVIDVPLVLKQAAKKKIETVSDFLSYAVTHTLRESVFYSGTKSTREGYFAAFEQLTAYLKPFFQKPKKPKKKDKEIPRVESDFPGQISLFDLM